jgi:para-aminobenzoate synthetase/4-amino-4-deoxychorismate lyase
MPNPRPDPAQALRPDPRQGVFETLLVAGGRPVELEAHLARLAASVAELFGAELGGEAREIVVAEAAGLRLGRLRLTATPGRGDDVRRPRDRVDLATHAEEIEPPTLFPTAERAVALRSLVVPGGLGPHKWADRTLLERAEARFSDDVQSQAAGAAAPIATGRPATTIDDPPAAPLPLLLDLDGAVLEASRANVFALRGGALVTPPADGRILPGIARAALIDVARAAGREVREEPLTIAELAAADGVFLTGSVRGLQPASSLDGGKLPPAVDATLLLAAALRRRWLRLRPPG